MASNPPPPPPPPARNDERPSGSRPPAQGISRYAVWIALGSLIVILGATLFLPGDQREVVDYTDFIQRVGEGQVIEAEYDNTNGGIDFVDRSGIEFTTVGPTPLPDDDTDLIRSQTTLTFVTPTPNFFASLIPLLIPVTLLILFFVWMQRRAQGQMGGIMQIGRSKAKTYSTERPGTMFDDVDRFYQLPRYDSLAGYLGPMSYFGVEDVVAEAAYSINEGEYSEPVRSSLGYHILYVEYIEFPAMLAEDEYQYRKKGVESQLRLRRQRLVSNEYIYELMSGLNVQTNNDNLLQLRDVISNLDGEGIIEQPTTAESAEALWTDERVERLANSFDRNAVLATYDLDGQTQVFSFGEYLNWLPYLSFQESKLRLGASVGRGMRNQVLFELASQQEYDRDERVQKKVSKRAIEILSELNQYEMTMKAVQDTGTVEVPESFRDRLISSRELLVQADYWKIPANSLQDARRIKREIEQGNKPLEYQGFNMVEYSALDAKENDYDLVRKSLIDTPVIAQSSEQGWMVLQVNRRDISEIATQTKVDDLQRSFKVYNTIQTEVDSLRALANIEIDTELFEEISKLWSPSNR